MHTGTAHKYVHRCSCTRRTPQLIGRIAPLNSGSATYRTASLQIGAYKLKNVNNRKHYNHANVNNLN